MIDWYVEGIQYSSCNCSYGCPCQFEADPTYGNCCGFEATRIERGHFGDVDLAGVRFSIVYAWPGPVYRGNGAMQPIIDVGATEPQRAALKRILHGEETREAATHWWVFHAMSSTVHPTLYLPIEWEVDIEARRARVRIPGVLEATGRPITSPVSGAEHRVRIEIPSGIEFEKAEIASGSIRTTGAIAFDLKDRYGQFNVLRHSGEGVVHRQVTPSPARGRGLG